MCLGVPGEVREVVPGALRMGTVAFGPLLKQVCLEYVPEAEVGDYVIVHAGFAISRLDREAAERVLATLGEADQAASSAGGRP